MDLDLSVWLKTGIGSPSYSLLSEEFTVSGLTVSDLLGRSLLFCSWKTFRK